MQHGWNGFIENNKAECILSVLVNANLLRACVKNDVDRYFFSSSACAYNTSKQKNTFIAGLKEDDAYPAMPEDGYGWENFLARECVDILLKILNYRLGLLDIIIFMGHLEHTMVEEKKLAALSRKIAEAKINKSQKLMFGEMESKQGLLLI